MGGVVVSDGVGGGGVVFVPVVAFVSRGVVWRVVPGSSFGPTVFLGVLPVEDGSVRFAEFVESGRFEAGEDGVSG